MPDKGRGQDGLLKMLEKILRYSVNTWNEGFMDKLYASTNAVSYHPAGGVQSGKGDDSVVGRNRILCCAGADDRRLICSREWPRS